MYLIFTASPNADGLTAACGRAAYEGFTEANAEAEVIDLSAMKIEPCRICGNGWGTCYGSAKCVILDGLEDLQRKFENADGVFLVTPVYWGQPSERMNFFLTRFRRCEALNKYGSIAKGKPAGLVAAAGGSGNGTVSCLTEMELWCRHVGAVPNEKIGVTRFNREQMLPAIKAAAMRMVK